MLQIRKLETLHVTATEGETQEQIIKELEHQLDCEEVDEVLFSHESGLGSLFIVKVVRRVEP